MTNPSLFQSLLAMRGELLEILGMSLLVSGGAVAVSMLLGVPLGIWMGLHRFPGRRFLVTLVNPGMGVPGTRLYGDDRAIDFTRPAGTLATRLPSVTWSRSSTTKAALTSPAPVAISVTRPRSTR